VPQDLLIIGNLVGGGIETLETALELGYRPINIPWNLSKAPRYCDTLSANELTGRHKVLPAILVDTRRYPDLEQERLDLRWIESTARARAELEALGVRNWVTLVHPWAHVSPSATVGHGVVVGPGATISSYAQIGNFVRVGRSSTIGHHCRVGDESRLGPGVVLPGGVQIGSRVLVGPGAVFVNDIVVADGAFVSAGSVVTRHIKGPIQVMGNPARVLRRPSSLLRKWLKARARALLRNTRYFGAVRHWYRTGQLPQ
jgi:acetyltransferase-like isoleucine patch superfamily enzyme